MRKVVFLLWMIVCSGAAFGQDSTQGSLYAFGKTGNELGSFVLKGTAVKADISGFISRVRVRQEFENNFAEPVEAVYVFPLSQNGAVDEMTMNVGERVIKGKVMRREEARKAYEAARSEGKTAALLDQERPNIFTQSVANIMPGEKIVVEIAYVETLKYEDGAYEFVFPMTVGPRYIPGSVKDAERISPPVAASRSGGDISIEVNLNAGVPVEEVRSPSHEVGELRMSPEIAKINLKAEKTIANKDFVLRYDVSGKRLEDAILTHRDNRGGFFTMILQPPDTFAAEDRTPKEIVFVLDTSGSMSGFPLDKAKEAMRLSLDGLYPNDTFNLITFSGHTTILFDEPVPATQANLERAHAFLESRRGGGGTEILKAIQTALQPSDSQEHLRIVCFMTDGYIGNEEQILAEVKKHPKARVFSFGIGNSVNRYLLDKLAAEGKGEAEYVLLTDDGSKAAKKFYERVRTPLLTDLSIDWNGMPVADLYPGKLTDLFSAKPVKIYGRFTKAAQGTIKLRGFVAGQPYEREIAVTLPELETANDVLATLWARTRIDDLSSSKLMEADPKQQIEIDSQITNLALEFGLLSKFTSFVAVEDRVVNHSGTPVTVQVPVENPEGVNLSSSRSAKQVTDLPLQTRTPLNLLSLQSGVAGSTSETVTVTSDGASVINTTSPTLTNTITSENYRLSTDSRSKSETRSSGTASGSGTGHGSGDGTGPGSGPPRSVESVELMKKAALNPAERKELLLKERLHTWLYMVVERLAKGSVTPTTNEKLFVVDGWANIQIDLTKSDPAVIKKLKAAGFELKSDNGKGRIFGRARLDKLVLLAEVAEVKFILPKV